jgi:hypothetical protein
VESTTGFRVGFSVGLLVVGTVGCGVGEFVGTVGCPVGEFVGTVGCAVTGTVGESVVGETVVVSGSALNTVINQTTTAPTHTKTRNCNAEARIL